MVKKIVNNKISAHRRNVPYDIFVLRGHNFHNDVLPCFIRPYLLIIGKPFTFSLTDVKHLVEKNRYTTSVSLLKTNCCNMTYMSGKMLSRE